MLSPPAHVSRQPSKLIFLPYKIPDTFSHALKKLMLYIRVMKVFVTNIEEHVTKAKNDPQNKDKGWLIFPSSFSPNVWLLTRIRDFFGIFKQGFEKKKKSLRFLLPRTITSQTTYKFLETKAGFNRLIYRFFSLSLFLSFSSIIGLFKQSIINYS